MRAPGNPPVIPYATVRALIGVYDRPGPRYTSYPPIPRWSGEFGASSYLEALARATADDGTFALYTHFPFCASRCLYCGCNATVTRHAEVKEHYLERLAREVGIVSRALGRPREVAQLHWGGGTPNHLDEAQLTRAFELLTTAFTLRPDAECSVEADPRLVTERQLETLRALGFTRISFGVQDTNPDVQAEIGRVQPEAMVRRVMQWARAAGFSSVNVDLIHGLPGQTLAGFRLTLDAVRELAPDRVACFAYAHLPQVYRHQGRMTAAIPDPASRHALFHEVVTALTGEGYRWIGMDHFARPGDPLTLAHDARRLWRNFMGYTTMPAQHLLGFGASSIGEVGGAFVQNAAHLGEWQRGIDAGALPVVRGHWMTPEDEAHRATILSLMCYGDVARAQAEATLCDAELLARMEADGLVRWTPDALEVLAPGRYFLRQVCSAFDAALAPAALVGG